MVAGGAGIWFLLGYVLFATISVVGFAIVSSLSFVIEVHEERKLNYGSTLVGFFLLYVGTMVGCLLLGVAGAMGGYVVVIEQSTVNVTRSVLFPYVEPITAAAAFAVTGSVFTIYGMVTAKASRD
jgi:FtsH-binding integral membrane protein